MDLNQLRSAPHIRAKYQKAVAMLLDELHDTWKRVLPPDNKWPQGTCQEFFQPFGRFGSALFDAYAEEILKSRPTFEQYAILLDFDLKTLVCDQIAPYRQEPVTVFQDALEADRRGEVSSEWEVRMRESWRMFDHPAHDKLHKTARTHFIEVFNDETNTQRSQCVTSIHNAISRRVAHWLAKRAEIGPVELPPTKGEEASPDEVASQEMKMEPTKTTARRGPKPDYETAMRVQEIVNQVSGHGLWRDHLEKICDELDDGAVKVPKTWKRKGVRNWSGQERELVVKAIEHHLENARTFKRKTIS
jgi:hypothetical protein